MFRRCAEIIERRGRKGCYNICVLVKTVSNFFDFRMVAPLKRIGVQLVSIAEQMHILQSLFGMSIVTSDLVLVELGNSDSSKNTDDRNDNQQLDECEA